MKRTAFVLPILYAITPVVALYANNIGQTRPVELVLPLAVMVALTLVLLPVGAWWFRGLLRAAVALSSLWYVVFAYGHLARLIGRVTIAGHNPANPKLLLPLLVVLFLVAGTWLRRSSWQPRIAARVLLVMALAMLTMSTVAIARFHLSRPRTPAPIAIPDAPLVAHAVSRTPDIYYLIFDRYGSASTLSARYGFDNTALVDSLRSLGFYVADDSRANYLVTAQSLASSLNATHIDWLSQSVGPVSSDWMPVFTLLRDNRVVRFLKAQGYRYVHMGPKWQPTAHNPLADVHYGAGVLPEFSMMLLSTTALNPVLYHVGVNNPDLEKYRTIAAQLDALAEMPGREPGPKLVFAHLLIPHGPFVFNRDGSYRTPDQATVASEAENYLEQVRYLNRRIQEFATALVEAYPADAPPVIVIQGDEGPYPPRTQPHEFDWSEATNEEFSEKMRILNAIYAPECEGSFYPSITPVNTFRIVFNRYFDTRLPMLSDRSYSYRHLKRLYDFIEVTDRINAVPPVPVPTAP